MKELDKLVGKAVVKTLDGEKLYKFRLLKRREAAKIYHTSVQTVVKLIAGAVGADTVEAKLLAIDSLDFDTIWNLASVLLKDCVVIPNMENMQYMIPLGSNLDDCDYFNDNNEELYIAIYHALRVNFPKSFSRLEKRLRDTIPGIQETISQKFSIRSTPKPQQPSQSQNGGE